MRVRFSDESVDMVTHATPNPSPNPNPTVDMVTHPNPKPTPKSTPKATAKAKPTPNPTPNPTPTPNQGFPGEEALNPGGGRYGKKVYCEGGSFVSAAGEVKVKANGGAWSTEPSGPY